MLPYLVPMLENAGAYVLMPRERDVQTEEAIADNDPAIAGASRYEERNGTKPWTTGEEPASPTNNPATRMPRTRSATERSGRP